jgi:ubiquitin-conjugating enzyme E2 Z
MKRAKKEKEVIISKESVHRLLKDVREIWDHPLEGNGIYYEHDDEDMLKGYALIVGPADTPYFGGFYFFELAFPHDYPHSPPVLKMVTQGDNVRFNPNLYVNGKVCISLLNTWSGEQWTSCQTISTVLLTLCTLLCKDPLLNEPGVTLKHQDMEKYTQIVEFKNIEIAILRVVTQFPDLFSESYSTFYPIVQSHWTQNRAAIQAFVETKAKEREPEKISTSFYGMSVVIDYSKLLASLVAL